MTYPASRVSFDLPDLSRKIEGDSARRVPMTKNVSNKNDKSGQNNPENVFLGAFHRIVREIC